MKVFKWVDDYIEEFLLVVLSIVMVTLIGMQVFMRYIMSSSLPWSEELARYCFIWLVYIGISYGVKRQRHIKVDVVLLLLKDKAKVLLGIMANILFLGFAIFVVIYGYDLSQRLLQFGQTATSVNIPMGFIYLATPVGMGLTAIRLLQQLVKQFKTLFGDGNYKVKTEQELILEGSQEPDSKGEGK
ncbi:C4-dicarboxylate transport system (permease small protein) (plasmid) [Alkalihalophilus pseudofirmus OF4]|uniref:C4-dicarboxylate transport system (Permease small protein) n=1 Tax=Alkalihalophilus pseudofirmus (strain ATCC BAA-2126 / JCM 17055 / OF4) TaxID=398511 RepID=D3G1S0_ALKPO|nr:MULTISPECIES: TRAP transporter small permease [Alkalihalophilus]ADC52296.1 C4-dicarboxylate transport system (permease small protein) [Alkalihalophilus pseudofirmus OF4]MED1603305.1 TRAP transporter small permease [Alkalihalophilus marmarensis]